MRAQRDGGHIGCHQLQAFPIDRFSPSPYVAALVMQPLIVKKLEPGARVALVAPSGPLRIPSDLERASSNATTLGWEPVIGGHAHEREDYFAGNDERRLGDLNDALRDDRIDAV